MTPRHPRRRARAPWRVLHLAAWALVAIAVPTPLEAQSDSVVAASPAAPRPGTQPTIVFMTDFGTANDAAAICRAVIVGIAPAVRIMDITHQVTPFAIEEAARFLEGVTPYYPAGTVFLVVVDPGVGTARKPLVVRTRRGQLFVLPDNGLITPVADRDGIEGAREITNSSWMIGDRISSTFQGRDVFSPAAAHLATGADWTQAGPPLTNLVRLEPRIATVDSSGIRGEIIGLDDPYGNLITDIRSDDFRRLGYAIGDRIPVTIGKRRFTFPFARTFQDVPIGRPLLYVDSRGRIGFALNQRNMSRTYGVQPPAPIFIPRRPGR
jgi:S-adenosylmethionine hydrolase